jgi:hypothetical protein
LIIFDREVFGYYLPFIGFAYVPFFGDEPAIYMTDEEIEAWEIDPWFSEVFLFTWLGFSFYLWNQEKFQLEEEE